MARLAWLILPLGLSVVLALAALLEPHPSGLGTHQALGLPPCIFLTLTGWICPSCGLTTSFTHLVHGNLYLSFYAHPLGPVLFALIALLSFFSLLEFLNKKTPLRRFLNGHYTVWVYGGLTIYLLTWGIRLASDYPG